MGQENSYLEDFREFLSGLKKQFDSEYLKRNYEPSLASLFDGMKYAVIGLEVQLDEKCGVCGLKSLYDCLKGYHPENNEMILTRMGGCRESLILFKEYLKGLVFQRIKYEKGVPSIDDVGNKLVNMVHEYYRVYSNQKEK